MATINAVGNSLSGLTGTGTFVGATSPTIRLPTICDTSDLTKTVGFNTGGATASTQTTLTFAQTANRAVTFPDATGTVAVGTAAPTAWTPVLTFGTPGDLSVVYSTQTGYYVQIGKLIIASAIINTSTFTYTSASGNLRVTGLPTAAYAAAGMNQSGGCSIEKFSKAGYSNFVPQVIQGQTYIDFVVSGILNVAVASITAADTTTTQNMSINLSVMYFVA